jgi:hypothetical protein
MPCNCGQKREALAASQFTPARRQAAIAGRPVILRSLNPSPVAITAFSGTRYRFEAMGSTQPVEKGDVDALLATGLFERDWVR